MSTFWIVFWIVFALLILWGLQPEKYPLYFYSPIKKSIDGQAFVRAERTDFERATNHDIPELPDYYAVFYGGKILYLHKSDAKCLTQ